MDWGFVSNSKKCFMFVSCLVIWSLVVDSGRPTIAWISTFGKFWWQLQKRSLSFGKSHMPMTWSLRWMRRRKRIRWILVHVPKTHWCMKGIEWTVTWFNYLIMIWRCTCCLWNIAFWIDVKKLLAGWLEHIGVDPEWTLGRCAFFERWSRWFLLDHGASTCLTCLWTNHITLSFEDCVPLIESYDMDNVFEELMSVHDIRFKWWQINIKTNWLILTDCSGEIQVQNSGLFLMKREHDVSESDNEFDSDESTLELGGQTADWLGGQSPGWWPGMVVCQMRTE